nr:DUF3422 family protein [Aliamphritea spongicola]
MLTLCDAYDVTPPDQDVAFFQMDLNGLQMRREKHLEFIAYTFTSRCDDVNAPLLTAASVVCRKSGWPGWKGRWLPPFMSPYWMYLNPVNRIFRR